MLSRPPAGFALTVCLAVARYTSTMGNSQQTVPDVWLKRFNDYLDEKPGGRDAWGDLLSGSNVALLTLLAAGITSGSPCALKEQRKRLRKFSDGLKAGIPQILSTAQLITELNRKVLDRGVDLKEFAELSGARMAPFSNKATRKSASHCQLA